MSATAITVGNTATSAALTAATGTSSTLALDNNKDTVIVAVSIRDTRTAATATATYGDDAMTVDITRLRTDGDSTADLRVYVFRKTQAKTGANNIVVTLSTAADYWAIFGIAVDRLTAVGQPNASGGADADNTEAIPPSCALTTTIKDTIVCDCVYTKAGTSLTAGVIGQTIVGQVLTNGGSDRALMGYTILAVKGLCTDTYTASVNDDWCMVAAAEKSTKSSEFFQMFNRM
jgi:hypothetical protein